MSWSDLLLRVRALLFRARVEEELDEEVDFHLAMAYRKYVAAGHSEEEAARLARRDFGRVGVVKEDCRSVRVRSSGNDGGAITGSPRRCGALNSSSNAFSF